MAMRFLCQQVSLIPGSVLHARYSRRGFYRPALHCYAVGPNGVYYGVNAAVDSGSDYVVFIPSIAARLGLSARSLRPQPASGAGGHPLSLLFAPAGQISLFVTDFREYCFLPDPLVGFHSPTTPADQLRSALGLSGFLEYFRFTLDHGPARPYFDLDPLPHAGGRFGAFPRGRSLGDFISHLRSA